MFDPDKLEGLRQIYWVVYPITLLIASAAFVRDRRGHVALGRAVAALALASAVMLAAESGGQGALPPLGHVLLDLTVLILVTMPPKSFWQATLGALVTAQVALSGIWLIRPDFLQWHYAVMLLIEFAKCAVLLLWAGGARVENAYHRIAGGCARLVLAARAGKLAR